MDSNIQGFVAFFFFFFLFSVFAPKHARLESGKQPGQSLSLVYCKEIRNLNHAIGGYLKIPTLFIHVLF